MPGKAPKSRGVPEPLLDDAVEQFGQFSASLVRLEPHSLEDVRRIVDGFASLVEGHLREAPQPPPGASRGVGRWSLSDERLHQEHDRFLSSIGQLREILAVVEADDHGGHRQALGQYGQIFVEALRVHRAEERRKAKSRVPIRPAHPHLSL